MDGVASPNGTTVMGDNEENSPITIRALELLYYFILAPTSKLARLWRGEMRLFDSQEISSLSLSWNGMTAGKALLSMPEAVHFGNK